MKKICAVLILSLCLLSCGRGTGTQEAAEAERILPEIGFFHMDYMVDSTQVRSGENFTSLMGRLGLGATPSRELVQLSDSIFDVRRLRAGNSIEAYYSGDSLSRKLEYAVYHNNRINSTIFQCGDSLAVWTYERPTTKERRIADVTITSSLWNDMKAAGATPELIVDLADIYQWSVNFFGLQKDDRFRFIYSQTLCEGEVISIDTVYFSLFNGGGKEVAAVLFQTEDGGKTYWDKGGASLKRMFLKAPLKYNRISSGFSYARKHPVTGQVRAHTAVDYAAPTGTPVHAIGDGTVTLCGWDGSGGGNRIRIKHAQGYESAYLHLSRFAKGIKVGSRVSQGELIGYVGSTGTSTGPHLDFRVWQNGKPINPLSLDSPASSPLDRQYLDEFNKVYDAYMAELGAGTDSLALAQPLSEQTE